MSSGIYSIGITGMNAAQLGLVTAEHNISNASTPGYNRQRTIQSTNTPVMTGAGAVGQGTHVQTIERMYSQFLSGQVNRSQTSISELDAYYSQISQIDNMLADPNSGLSTALQDFFKGVQQVAGNPSSLPARQAMVSSAETMVARYQGLESRLAEISDSVNGQIVSAVASVNSYAQQIANLNERIIVAQAAAQQPANDLLDQRDQLVTELNKLVRVSTTEDSSGAFNVFIGTGQQLVVGTRAMQMAVTAASADPERFVLGLKPMGGGNVQELPEKLITGGQLGGLLSFRTESLDSAFNKLGQVAATMALTFNAQHALGQDLQGNIAGDTGFVGNMFTLGAPRVAANAHNALGGPVVQAALAPASFSGNNFVTNLTGSDYRLSYNGTDLTLTRLTDNKKWVALGSSDVADINALLATDSQGFTLNASTTGFTANDSFLIQPTRYAARNIDVNANISSDPRLIAAAAPIRTKGEIANTGSMKMSQGATQSGYSLAGLPVTMTVAGTQLTNVPGTATVTYSDNSTASPVLGAINLLNGAATLKNITFDGLSFDISGTPVAADRFTVERNTSSNGVADGRNALLLGKLQSQGTVSGGAANYQAAYAQLVSDNGNKTREIQVTRDAQKSLFDQSSAAREAMSGVNLDEEAANLIRYQQAYQASAKMLSIGTKLFDTLLSISG